MSTDTGDLFHFRHNPQEEEQKTGLEISQDFKIEASKEGAQAGLLLEGEEVIEERQEPQKTKQARKKRRFKPF